MSDSDIAAGLTNRRNTWQGIATRTAVDTALEHCRASLMTTHQEEPPDVGAAITGFAACVRDTRMPPERFLAVFKRMAAGLPWVTRLSPDERAHRVSAMSAAAINAYYGHAPTPSTPENGQGSFAGTPNFSSQLGKGLSMLGDCSVKKCGPSSPI